MTLHDLEIGDKFYPASKRDKTTPIYQVIGKPEFNAKHGSATRMCIDLLHKIEVSKSCRLEIIKSTNNKA